jgi:hypothetical protein
MADEPYARGRIGPTSAAKGGGHPHPRGTVLCAGLWSGVLPSRQGQPRPWAGTYAHNNPTT